MLAFLKMMTKYMITKLKHINLDEVTVPKVAALTAKKK